MAKKDLSTEEILGRKVSNLVSRQCVLDFLTKKKVLSEEIEAYTEDVHFKISTASMPNIVFDNKEGIRSNLRFKHSHMYYLCYIVEAIKEKTGNTEIYLGMNPGQYGYVKIENFRGSSFYSFAKHGKSKTPQEEKESFAKKLDRI